MATPTTFQHAEQLIPVFNGENYDLWSTKMCVTLMSRGLWDVVSKGKDELALGAAAVAGSKAKVQEITMKDMSALHILHMAVVDSIFPVIAPAKSSKEAWDLLQAKFQGLAWVRTLKLCNLKREFETLQMEENEGVKEFTGKVEIIANRMKLYGETKRDDEIVGKILASLPPIYDGFVSHFVQDEDHERLTISDVTGALLAYEWVSAYDSDTSTEVIFQDKGSMKIKGSNRNQKSEAKNKTIHKEEYCCFQDKQTRGEGSGNGKGAKQCFKCQKFGHYAHECRSKPVTTAPANHQTEEDDLLFTSECDSTILEKNGVWVVSMAAPNHMAKDRSLFVNMDKRVKIPLRASGGDVLMSAGKGDVRIVTKKGHKILKDVLYVPGLFKNLLSAPQFGGTFEMDEESCQIRDASGKLIADIKMENGLFQVGIDNSIPDDCEAQICSLLRLA